MSRQHNTHRKPRDTTRAVPFVYSDPSKGIRVTVTTLRYWVEPQPSTPVTAWPIHRTTLAEVKADVNRTLAVEAHKRRYAVPPQLVPREPIAVAPIPAEPFTPRVIRQDADGYSPPTSYTRTELVALLLRAARYA